MAPVMTNDMMALFAQFLAMNEQNKPATAKAEKPAKQAKKADKAIGGVHVHALENSFFVYGEGAPAKLEAFFAKKPHLNRGFKEREITGVGKVKAFWFGGRQFAKIDAILNPKAK